MLDPYKSSLTKESGVDDDEREDLQILPTDNLIVAAKTEDDVSYLEVYVYESTEDNIYVHHDIMLPSLPLCIEWLNFNVNTSAEDDGTRRGNMAAVGTFDPDIEIWDLDVVETVYPDAILGSGAEKSASLPDKKKNKKKKKKKKWKGMNDQFHVDAVMSLSANRLQRNLFLSGSADTTVKLWDLTNGSSANCVKSFGFHSDKVSGLQWHPSEAYIALTGSYDKSVFAADFRTTDGKGANWTFNTDVEGVRWNPHDSNYFYVLAASVILSYNRYRRIMVSCITMTCGHIRAKDRNQSGFYRRTTKVYHHLTSRPLTPALSLQDQQINSSNYGMCHQRVKGRA
jgi:periodic tryptophan protein 1